MCFFGGSTQRPAVEKYKSKNDAAVVTGMQTGVENPKDTKKVSDELKIQREKKEDRYVDPNIATAEKLTTTKRRSMTMAEKEARTARQNKAKSLANARMKSKFKSSPTGRQTGVA
tara:strand:- start:177 stop:521 length:345 start_codon:yes stop_codon:yes gene_type:complete